MERAVGLASILPAFVIGFGGLADYAGPTGWRGVSEFVGFVVVCAGVGVCVGLLLGQLRQPSAVRYAAIPLAVAAVIGFTYVIHWLGLGAPMPAKIAFTTLLQMVGALTPVGVVVIAARAGVRQRY